VKIKFLPRQLTTREGLLPLSFLLCAVIIFSVVIRSGCGSNYKYDAKREVYKRLKPDITPFKRVVAEPNFENLKMIGFVGQSGVGGRTSDDRLYGMILRTLRFQNISRKVERKYKLPENLILAMIMQESCGIDLLPNSSDDGGAGLCHMQPYMANLFGLKTHQNCKAMRSIQHGKALRWLISKYKNDRATLIGYDERFSPVFNIDAAGRMLAYYIDGPQYRNTKLKTALLGYAGRNNYRLYYKRVTYYLELLNDEDFIDEVRDRFNALNPDFKINGRDAGFDEYIAIHQQLNRNYGLDDY